jgi:signal transduction histidine kinase
LLAGTLVWIAATLVVAGFGLAELFRAHVEAQFHAELKTHLDQLAAALVLNPAGEVAIAVPLSDPRLSRPYAGLYWQVDRLNDGAAVASARGVLRSRSLWDGVLQVPPDRIIDGEIHHHRVAGTDGKPLVLIERQVSTADPARGTQPTFRLLVAADESLMVEPIRRFNGSLVVALGSLGLGLVAAAVMQVAVGLTPLRRVHAALAAVRLGRAQRVEGRYPSDIQPLVDELNSLLAQNTAVVERARSQAGNLAHALKTPLAVLANAATANDADLPRLVGEQVAAANRQVDYHLRRSRAAAAVAIPGTRTPLRPVAEGLVRVMERVHAAKGLDWAILPIAPITGSPDFAGEEQDLQEMLGNLLDNAGKWARQRVQLGLAVQGDRLIVHIDDDGPGIAPPRRAAMLRRGARDDEQVAGSGLGLAIAADLARLYGGDLELADSPLGGLRAVLTLPAAAG